MSCIISAFCCVNFSLKDEDKKVQDFLHFHDSRSCYIMGTGGTVQGTEP